MSTDTGSQRGVLCPSCRNQGKKVKPLTVRALLKDEFASEVIGCDSEASGSAGCTPVDGDTGYRFCDSKECEVVYFAEATGERFTKSQLKVPVGVKEDHGERPLCYCFGHSIGSIKKELRTKGRSEALEDIRRKMMDPGCHCETANPSGSCCLGSVGRGIEVAERELVMNDSNDQGIGATTQRSIVNRGENIAKVGALVSAVVASSCCWLPLVFLAIGVSGVGIASVLEAYRPVFMVVTFGFLGAAFYLTYRPKRMVVIEDCCTSQESGVGDCCAPGDAEDKGRLGLMRLNKVMLWVVTAVAVAFLLFPNYVGAFFGTRDGKTITENMNQAVLTIEGMTCDACAMLVGNAIRNVPGVLAAEVDYQKGEAVVGADTCCPVPKEKILAALKEVGYDGMFIEEKVHSAKDAVPAGS